MLVLITSDRFGGYTVIPVSESIQRKYAKHMADFDIANPDGSIYFQGDYELPEEVTTNRQWRYLRDGWDIRIRVDPWVYGHWLGWDACNVEI